MISKGGQQDAAAFIPGASPIAEAGTFRFLYCRSGKGGAMMVLSLLEWQTPAEPCAFNELFIQFTFMPIFAVG